MLDKGFVRSSIESGIGTITFYHPKSNSLTAELLQKMTTRVTELGADSQVRVIIIRSEGERAFCAGASFEELVAVDDFEQGKEFFMGFARLILAMINCPKFIIARVHQKVVGGGVGIAAAADYTMATKQASAKLSEFALGIGPFVVGPAVERKIGTGPHNAMAIDHDWRDADWCRSRGLYAQVYETVEELDEAVEALAIKLAHCSLEATADLKRTLWDGTEHWKELLEARAEINGRLVLSEFTRNYIKSFKNHG